MFVDLQANSNPHVVNVVPDFSNSGSVSYLHLSPRRLKKANITYKFYPKIPSALCFVGGEIKWSHEAHYETEGITARFMKLTAFGGYKLGEIPWGSATAPAGWTPTDLIQEYLKQFNCYISEYIGNNLGHKLTKIVRTEYYLTVPVVFYNILSSIQLGDCRYFANHAV